MTIYRFHGVVLPSSMGRDRYRPGVIDARDADLFWGDIHCALPWGHLPGNGCEHYLPNPDAAEVATCEKNCPLYLEDGADCNQIDPRCPFYRSHHKQQAMAKASYRMRNKWERELDQAVERILAEREAECAT